MRVWRLPAFWRFIDPALRVGTNHLNGWRPDWGIPAKPGTDVELG